MSKFHKVKIVSDGNHDYIIPNKLDEEFYNDLEDEEFVDSGKFDDKYRKYRTGGSINSATQLYTKGVFED